MKAINQDAIEILKKSHFEQFNQVCKFNRNPGQIKAFDKNLKALGMLERAALYLEAAQ
jgi:hypothetical protein